MASAVLDAPWPTMTQPPQPRLAGAGFLPKLPNPNSNPNPNPNNPNSRVHQNGDFSNFSPNLSHYVTFDISTYSRSELRDLKTRLTSELDRVRSLSTRIESSSTQLNPKKRKDSSLNPNLKRVSETYVASPQVMKMCQQVLTKLMKQKAGYVFNSPVDVVGMGLHDYHQIIKKPMDLGTIKKNLGNGLYSTPEEFAVDVRLCFNNALKYNPKGHEVHALADQFLGRFEQLFRPVYQKFHFEKAQMSSKVGKPDNQVKESPLVVVDEVQGSSWSRKPSPSPAPPLPPPPRLNNPPKKPEPSPQGTPPPPPQPPQPALVPVTTPAQAPLPAPSQVQAPEVVKGHVGRAPSGKLPKPKAKDVNKREMNMEEKHKLGVGLQSLPEEKMAQVIQIIRKRNGHLTQDGDEIELDIEAVDTETLWELDRFVTNYRKMVSKVRRQAMMGVPINNVGHLEESNQVGMSDRTMETGKVKKGVGDVMEEDVDIGDEMPVNNFPPLEIEKDDDRQQGGASSSSSSSSSSGSDSSSSSDSDSGSSSGSDSDVDDAQSRDNESKNIHP